MTHRVIRGTHLFKNLYYRDPSQANSCIDIGLSVINNNGRRNLGETTGLHELTMV